jgi:hypothetical protein
MSLRGLSDLIVTIMAAGGVDALPARDHRRCHEALMMLADSDEPAAAAVWRRLGGLPSWRPDARVGRHVEGVTPALWELVNRGQMSAREFPDRAEYVLSARARTNARRDILRLPAAEAHLLYRVGAAWAAASTSRKNLARAEASPASTRRSSLA